MSHKLYNFKKLIFVCNRSMHIFREERAT